MTDETVRRRWSWLAAVVLIVGVVVATVIVRDGRNGPSGDESFDIGMVTFAGYAPLYLAKEKGFYGDLQVQLHRIEEIPSIRAGVSSGKLEAYLATPDIALDIDEKPPGVAVWAIDESSGGDGVVVAEGIDNISDLKGKNVASEPGLPPHFVLLYLLHENGIALSDLAFQDMTTQNASTAFVAGSVDAAGLYEPYLSTARDQREGSKVVLSSAETRGLVVELLFVDESIAENRTDDIKKVIEGWRRAVAFIKESPDEAYEIMANAFGLPVDEFTDIASGVTWLDLQDNKELFGTEDAPGPLYRNFDVVGDVLRRNRPTVYKANAADHLTRGLLDVME